MTHRRSLRKKTILLVNPWIHDFAAYDFWIKPLGLLYLAGILRKNGYAIRFIDCLNPYHPGLANDHSMHQPKRKPWGQGKYPRKDIPKPGPLLSVPRTYYRYGISPPAFINDVLCGDRPEIILVTGMMTYWYPGVIETIRTLAGILPDTPVLLGGPYATLCTDHARRYSGAAAVLTGEGEKKISMLIREWLNDDPTFLPDTENLDSFPYPAFDLIPRLDQVPILTSRGCPHRCTYCASPLLNNHFRRRDPVKVADEITYWHTTFAVHDFSIYDDAFLVNPEDMAAPLLNEIIRRKLPCRFHCPNGLHLREITDDIAHLLFRAGFVTIRFGFETSRPESQRETGGKVTNRDLCEAVRSLAKAGYREDQIGVYLLCGLPGQGSSEITESIHFVRSCGAKPLLAEYSPIPGTPLWTAAKESSPYPLDEEPLFHNNSLLPCGNGTLTPQGFRELKRTAKANRH